MRLLGKLATFLIVVGALNWGLVGLLNFDAIEYIFGPFWLDRLIYIVIGIAALFKIISWQKKS